MGWCSDCDQYNSPCLCTFDRVRADERARILDRIRAVPIRELAAVAPTPPFAEIEAVRAALLAAVEEK